jgi:hypothetical protein
MKQALLSFVTSFSYIKMYARGKLLSKEREELQVRATTWLNIKGILMTDKKPSQKNLVMNIPQTEHLQNVKIEMEDKSGLLG